MLSGAPAGHGERLEPRRDVRAERAENAEEVLSFGLPLSGREDRRDEESRAILAQRQGRREARRRLSVLRDVGDEQSALVAVDPHRIVDLDVDRWVAGEEVQAHLLEIVEAVRRDGEGLVD